MIGNFTLGSPKVKIHLSHLHELRKIMHVDVWSCKIHFVRSLLILSISLLPSDRSLDPLSSLSLLMRPKNKTEDIDSELRFL